MCGVWWCGGVAVVRTVYLVYGGMLTCWHVGMLEKMCFEGLDIEILRSIYQLSVTELLCRSNNRIAEFPQYCLHGAFDFSASHQGNAGSLRNTHDLEME